MKTDHQIFAGDSRSLSKIDDNSVELVVTSPPYPMVEMWDELFAGLNSEIGDALDANQQQNAFELMHDELNKVWREIRRVLVDGGIACINVGDAARNANGTFRIYPNHSHITSNLVSLGFDPLPEILWRKPVNSPNKFMGSGMIPPNQYVTLEHEYILCFRNGSQSRSFPAGDTDRYESAYFREERNQWFTDLWEDVVGADQTIDTDVLRDRSAAFPFIIPYRLINMYSLYGDTVLDPFWGTGTTSVAALVAGRDSFGYELDSEFIEQFRDRVERIHGFSKLVVENRINSHLDHVRNEVESGARYQYENSNYGFPVKTRQERDIRFYKVSGPVSFDGSGEFTVSYEPVQKSIDMDDGSPKGEPTSLFDYETTV